MKYISERRYEYRIMTMTKKVLNIVRAFDYISKTPLYTLLSQCSLEYADHQRGPDPRKISPHWVTVIVTFRVQTILV